MKVDLVRLHEEVEAGNVNVQRHSSLPLSIYKYSKQAVYTRHWNEITLRCRGVVLDEESNVVVNGFLKFFNHDEQDGRSGYEMHKDFPYVVTEKLDGSLIQAAKYRGELVVTSSGSFESPQALRAKEMINPSLIEEGKTYVFEIIYPENRIVLDYGDKVSLTLLAVRDTDTGHEFLLDEYEQFDRVKSVNMTLEEVESDLVRADYINKEGYVVRFADGFRVKCKYHEYMRLHKIVSGVNEKYVWECLRDKVDFETNLGNIPDELYDFIKKTKADLLAKYADIESQARNVYEYVNRSFPTRKDQAKEIMTNFKSVSSIVFAMLDKKDYSLTIWKMVEPEVSFRRGMGESNE